MPFKQIDTTLDVEHGRVALYDVPATFHVFYDQGEPAYMCRIGPVWLGSWAIMRDVLSLIIGREKVDQAERRVLDEFNEGFADRRAEWMRVQREE